MSKKANSVAAMQRAIDKAKAQKARDEKKLKQTDAKRAELREQVRQMRTDAARHGVDLDALPTKKQAAAAAAQAVADKAAAESKRVAGLSTAERMAEHLTASSAPYAGAPSVRHRYPARSADRLALGLLDQELVGRSSDPSRNVLPTDVFLRPTHEVVAGQRAGQPLQSQYRQPAQTRTVPPQATTRNPLHRPWGAAPGQLGGVKLTQDGGR